MSHLDLSIIFFTLLGFSIFFFFFQLFFVRIFWGLLYKPTYLTKKTVGHIKWYF